MLTQLTRTISWQVPQIRGPSGRITYHATIAPLNTNSLERHESLIEIYHEIMDSRRASERYDELLSSVVSKKIRLGIG